ncbi:MAG: hypothetical protein K6F10_04670 [Paludibacteraceae bacterium]|nr:hypothetical protein [Paludibacteraceae bacterium]
MKKYFYVAIMALTLGMFAGCTGVSAPKEPVIDEEAGTVNGVKYDNETYKCWLVETESTSSCTGETPEQSSDKYLWWMTEFDAQSYKAEFEYTSNVKACAYGYCCETKGSCKITETNHTQAECSSSNL